jgi:hypothetical protein
MLSRALSLATVTLLIGCYAAAPSPALAQATNLEAGKSPSQIFAGTCTACHKGPRGLLKTVPAGSLQGFLRQHYTTSPEMASLLSAFLISNGATDTRYGGAQTKPAKDAKSEAGPSALPDHIDRFGRRVRPPPQEAKPGSEPQQAARPEPDVASPPAEPAHADRNAKRLARPGEPAEAAKPDGQAPAQAALEHGPDGRKTAGKQKLSKRGRPGGEEPPKADAAKEEPAKGEAPQEDKPKGESAKETVKEEGSTPPSEAKPEAKSETKSESAKIEAPKETGAASTPSVLRADPVPPVTPAPSASPATSAAVSTSTPEPAPAAAPLPAASPPPAVTASVPPPAPAGPPAPPISQ